MHHKSSYILHKTLLLGCLSFHDLGLHVKGQNQIVNRDINHLCTGAFLYECPPPPPPVCDAGVTVHFWDGSRSLYGNNDRCMGRARDFMQLHILRPNSPFCRKISLFAFSAGPVNFNGKCSKLLFQWYKSAVKHIFRSTLDKFCKSPSFNMISYMVILFKPLSFSST